jgi:ceramide glucosyltransferase
MSPSPSPPRLAHYPSVTVVRPVRGIDAGIEDNLRAALHHGYPGSVETLFVVDDEEELALPAIVEAIDMAVSQGPIDARVVIAGEPPPARTGKVNAMIAGLAEASGELVVFADSDIRPNESALTTLVETLLATPEAGSAFAPVLVAERPRTVGDAGYALLLNGLYGPAAAAAAKHNDGSLPFIMGQFMVFKRAAIDAIGGLQCADGQLVDDMYLGARVHAAGMRNMVSPHPVPIIQHDLPLADFFKVYLRWLTFSRSGLPGREFKLSSWLRGAVFWTGLVLAGLAAAMGHGVAMLVALSVPISMTASINALHRAHGSAPLPARHWLVAFGVLLTGPVVMLTSMLSREVSWRGRRYALNGSARLDRGNDDRLPTSVTGPTPPAMAMAAAGKTVNMAVTASQAPG